MPAPRTQCARRPRGPLDRPPGGSRRPRPRHLAEQGLDSEALAATPVITAVVAEGRRLVALAAEAKAVAAAVLEHRLFATKAGLERRIVISPRTSQGHRAVASAAVPALRDINQRMARSAEP